MTTEELDKLINEVYEDEFLKFDKIENKKSNRADLHAFLLLDSILPGNSDIISAAEHDEIWLNIDVDDLAEVITEEQVVELVRCGVRYSDDSLCMFA